MSFLPHIIINYISLIISYKPKEKQAPRVALVFTYSFLSFANTDKIPNDAITNREEENEKDARELFVKGVENYSKDKNE